MESMQDTGESVENKLDTDNNNARVYELGYLLVPTLSEEEVPVRYANLKDLVQSFGGEMIADEMPKMIELAYQMLKVTQNVRSKFNNAYFGWIKFEMDASKVLELKKKLDLDPNVLRFLILKTVKENTIATKRFVYKEGTGVRRKPFVAKKESETEGEVVPINKEEIDKEIDAMVAV